MGQWPLTSRTHFPYDDAQTKNLYSSSQRAKPPMIGGARADLTGLTKSVIWLEKEVWMARLVFVEDLPLGVFVHVALTVVRYRFAPYGQSPSAFRFANDEEQSASISRGVRPASRATHNVWVLFAGGSFLIFD